MAAPDTRPALEFIADSHPASRQVRKGPMDYRIARVRMRCYSVLEWRPVELGRQRAWMQWSWVDMQVGLLDGPPKQDLQGVIQRINLLTAMVRKQSGKVIWIRHCGKTGDGFERHAEGWSFLPELSCHRDDVVIEKTLNDPFVGTSLQETLERIAPDRVLVAGWATDSCVDATIRSAISNEPRRCCQRRSHRERSASPGCSHRDPASPLGVEQPHH